MHYSKVLDRIVEPKIIIPEERKRFSNRDLFKLLVPILIEQILTTLVGMVDTLMISYAGQAAISGVSLVNQLAHTFIFVFSATAAGGAVVVSQYLGRGDSQSSSKAASQFVSMMFLLGLVITTVCITLRHEILNALFGSVEPDVMEAAVVYLVITAASWPFLGLYSCSTALYRSMARTKRIAKVSLVMNIINVVGNFIGIFILHWGVVGVAVPTLIARFVAALIMYPPLFRAGNPIVLKVKEIFAFRWSIQRKIYGIALPGAVESFLFNISKVSITSIVSTFGTVQIAANGVASNFWSMCSLCCLCMGYAFVTVIGQCMGAGDVEASEYYFKKMIRLTYVLSWLWNIVIFSSAPLLVHLYALPQETKALAVMAICLHNFGYCLVGPIHSSLPNGLRACGDVKFVTFAAIFSTCVCRYLFALLFGVVLGFGLLGVVLAMVCDWMVKAVLVWLRYRSGKWRTMKVI